MTSILTGDMEVSGSRSSSIAMDKVVSYLSNNYQGRVKQGRYTRTYFARKQGSKDAIALADPGNLAVLRGKSNMSASKNVGESVPPAPKSPKRSNPHPG